MKYKLTFFLSCFILLGQTLIAQNITVTGKITDEKGIPLIGANVISTDVNNGVNGTVADFDGNYSIKITPQSKLSFTYVGYITQEFSVDGKTEINVTLLPDRESLSEVVVVGYNKVKRENIIGAVATITGSDILESGLTNISQAIQDRLPGVFTEIPSGQPGADDAKITIRGVSSFNGDNSPLILIDGVEASGGYSQLDPSEIASFSVLKDAASTAVYGVRGADGVILITTKRGRLGAPKVSVGGATTAKVLSDIPRVLSSYDVLTLGQEAIKNGGLYGDLRPQRYINNFLDPNRDQIAYPDVDWYGALFRDIGWESNARVNVSGGTEFVTYFSSLSMNHVGDILQTEDFNGYYDPEFSYDKVNFRTNLDFNFSETTKLSVDISGRTDIRKTPDANIGRNDFNNIFKFIDQATPYLFPLYYTEEFVLANPDSNSPFPGGVRFASAIAENPFSENPYTELNYSGMEKFKTDVVDIQVRLNQKLDGITKGLSISGKFNYSTAFVYKTEERFSPHTWLYDPLLEEWRPQAKQNYNQTSPEFRSSGGERYESVKRNLYYEAKLNYDRKFGDHTVAAIAVFNRQEKEINIANLLQKTEDWVGILNYNYQEKYLLSLTSSYNGTDKFARGKSFGFFPGIAVGWNIAKEKIVQENLPWMNTFKVRYNYGETGTANNIDPFLYLGGYSQGSLDLGYAQFGLPIRDEIPRWYESKLASPTATWNTSIKHNLGFDIELFDYELTMGFNLYKENRTDILVGFQPLSFFQPSVGTQDGGKVPVPKLNLGAAKNHGLEFETNYKHTTPNGLGYSVGGFVTLVDSRILIRDDRIKTADYQKHAGKPIGWLRGLHSNGFINNFEEAINSPQFGSARTPGHYSYSDFNGDGKIDNLDKIPLDGTSQPQVTYAFNGGINYKGFDLSVRFFGKEGVTYHSSNLFPYFNGTLLSGKSIHLNRWSPENQNAAFPAFGHVRSTQTYQNQSNKTIVNSSYLKLQNVRISYNLKSEFLKKALRIQKMNFSLTGQNLYTWSKVPFGEPEGGNGVSGGTGQYPIVKRFVFGVNIDF